MSEIFDLLDRNPDISGGKPIIKGTRISVALVLEWLATGGSPEKINEAYPNISVEAVYQSLWYASRELSSIEYIQLPVAV